MFLLKKYHGLSGYIYQVLMSYIYAISFIKPVGLMKKLTAFVLLFGVFVGFGLEQAQAQTRIEIGPRLGFDIAGDVEEFFIGFDSRFTIPDFPVILNGNFDYYFVDNFDFWQLSANILYEFGVDNQSFAPYAGAGLSITRASADIGGGLFGVDASSTDLGLNVVGGAIFGQSKLKPFAQAQLTFGDVDLFTIAGGLLFNVGG